MDARREAETEQMAQTEDLVDDTGAIRVVLVDDRVPVMIEQAVGHLGGVTRVGTDLGCTCIKITAVPLPYSGLRCSNAVLVLPSGQCWLSRGRYCAIAPMSCELDSTPLVDDLSEPARVTFFTNLPVGNLAQALGRTASAMRVSP